MLLLVTICIRSGVGLSMSFPWKSQIILLMLLTFCIALGKGLGGFLADYFGWIKIAVGGLIISALLLFYGTQTPAAGIIGMFLYNLTMPVTLVAVSNLLPGKPGFSFGLTTFALMAGALPSFFNFKDFLSRSPVIFFLVVISAVFLFSGLRLYNQNMK
jgi:FSR family fosmidomycin resistance protein-like MFS transporter